MPSKEDSMEMSVEDQERLQRSGAPQALTIEALQEHDLKTTTGPHELRQFACEECHVSWWRTVIKINPVSRCKGGKCGQQRYNALSRDKEFGIGRCVCPNENCDFEFYVRCEASRIFKCCKCRTECKPYVHPIWKKKKKKRKNKKNKKSQDAASSHEMPPAGEHRRPPTDFSPHQVMPLQSCPPGGAALVDDNIQAPFSDLAISDDTAPVPYHPEAAPPPRKSRRKKPKREIFNVSEIHEPTGGTVSTFLTQIDFERNAKEVPLEYESGSDFSSDDDDGSVPHARKFRCDCGNEYTVVCRKIDTAPCYDCERINSPFRRAARRNIQRKSDKKHSCSRCNGLGNCPNLEKPESIATVSFPQWDDLNSDSDSD